MPGFGCRVEQPPMPRRQVGERLNVSTVFWLVKGNFERFYISRKSLWDKELRGREGIRNGKWEMGNAE